MQTLTQPKQLALQLPIDPELLDAKAREIFNHSRYLSGKYASFNKLMADPVLAKSLRLCAKHLLGSTKKTRSH